MPCIALWLLCFCSPVSANRVRRLNTSAVSGALDAVHASKLHVLQPETSAIYTDPSDRHFIASIDRIVEAFVRQAAIDVNASSEDAETKKKHSLHGEKIGAPVSGKIGTTYIIEEWAVKHVPFSRLSESYQDEAENEIKVNLELFRPGGHSPSFLPYFHGVIKRRTPEGSLDYLLVFHKLFEDLTKVSEDRSRLCELVLGGASSNLIIDLKRILRKMHDLHFYHNDVVPGNIMFDEAGSLFLIDLGTATHEPLMAGESSVDDRAIDNMINNFQSIEAECNAAETDGEEAEIPEKVFEYGSNSNLENPCRDIKDTDKTCIVAESLQYCIQMSSEYCIDTDAVENHTVEDWIEECILAECKSKRGDQTEQF